MIGVILAAGRGERLNKFTENHPKPLLKIKGRSILERSINILKNSGISKIIISTGYKNDMIDAFVKKYLQNNGIELITVYNPYYEEKESSYSLYNLRDYIDDDFILVEGDLLFESKVIQSILHNQKSDYMISSKKSDIEDGVYIGVNSENIINQISKNLDEIDNFAGEIIGISKISQDTFKKIVDSSNEDTFQKSYEYMLQDHLSVNYLEDIKYHEIDNLNHLIDVYQNYLKFFDNDEKLLFTPGPLSTSSALKNKNLLNDICSREKLFREKIDYSKKLIRKIFDVPQKFEIIYFSGSATASMESLITNYDNILFLNNGTYSDRAIEIANNYNIKNTVIKLLPDEDYNFKLIEETILRDNIQYIYLVHHETSTGQLNDFKELYNRFNKYNVKILLDATSSFGAIPINFKYIDALFSCSNKCIEGLPGLSFVIINKTSISKNAKTYYTNLYKQWKNFEETQEFQFTPPVQILSIFIKALELLKDEGIQSRYNRYMKNYYILEKTISELGLKILIQKNGSKLIMTIESDAFKEIADYLESKNIIIYNGKVKGTYRIAVYGNIFEEEMFYLTTLLKEFYEKM